MSHPSQSDYDHDLLWDCFVEIRDLLTEIRDGLARRPIVASAPSRKPLSFAPLESPVIIPLPNADPRPDDPYIPPQCTGGE